MLINHLKSACRNLWKNKITGAINITGLSVGMTAAVLIMLWVQSETSFDNYKDKNSIYRITTRIPAEGWVWETSPLLLAPAIKNEVPEVEKTARLYTGNLPVFSISGNLFYEKACAYVDSGWFNLFKYTFTAGGPASFNKNPFSIILTESTAKKYFGDQRAVGKTIHVDSVDYEISGVIKDAPVNSSFQYNVFFPIAALLTNPQIRENDEQWNNDNYVTFIKLGAATNPANVAREITAVVKRKGKDDNSLAMSLTPLSDMHFENDIQNSIFLHGNSNMVYLFSFLGFLLLLIACINYVNLTTAKSSLRAKEVSIRKINGATRISLFCQFVVESLLISLISLVVTLVLLQVSLPLFNNLTGKSFSFPITSLLLWEILIATLVASTLLTSIYPALLLSSFKHLNIFSGITLMKAKKGSFR
jgi:putative ABC transport system permease protein